MTERISYNFCESLLARQDEAERSMLDAFAADTYTLEHPFLRVNPYLINPWGSMP